MTGSADVFARGWTAPEVVESAIFREPLLGMSEGEVGMGMIACDAKDRKLTRWEERMKGRRDIYVSRVVLLLH